MSVEPTKAEKIRGLRWAAVAVAPATLFTTIVFGPVLVLFLAELGIPKGKMGLILSFMPFCGLLALVVAPAAARVGLKRTFITFWSLRKIVFFLLVFAPLVLERFGFQAVFIYVAAVYLGFAVCRAVAETALLPWSHEYVPKSVRGKFGAINALVGRATGMLALAITAKVMSQYQGMTGYVILITGGSMLGLMSALAWARVPGGRKNPASQQQTAHLAEVAAALRDRNFVGYLAARGLATAGAGLMVFTALFLKERVGMSPASVVALPIAATVGSTLFFYLWGWAADRYGGKPVLLSSAGFSVFLPLCWLILPRQSDWSYLCALGIFFVGGAAGAGVQVGSVNLLFNAAVPPEKKTGYLAVFYAWSGVVGGLSAIMAGGLLEAFKGLQGGFSAFTSTPIHRCSCSARH